MKNVPAMSKKQEPHFLRSKSSARKNGHLDGPPSSTETLKNRLQGWTLQAKTPLTAGRTRFSGFPAAANHQGRQPQQTQGCRSRFRNLQAKSVENVCIHDFGIKRRQLNVSECLLRRVRPDTGLISFQRACTGGEIKRNFSQGLSSAVQGS